MIAQENADAMLSYLGQLGIAYKKVEADHVYAECPFCHHSSKKFTVNTTTGVWKCFHCEKAGNHYQFGVEFGLIEKKKPFKVVSITKAKSDYVKPKFNVAQSVENLDDYTINYLVNV